MPTVMSKEDWLKGVMGLEIVKDALIPTLKTHYLQKAKEWNTDDDHLKHLLDLGAANEIKQVKREESTWYVNCSECRSILKMIEMTHSRPARLMWMNNQRDDSCPSEYRLAKIFMPGGNKMTKDYSDLDALVILEILKNDTSFEHSYKDCGYLTMFRNRLMHSNNNRISGNELDEAFDRMKNLLQNDMFREVDECKAANEELEKIKKKNMIVEVDESNENWKLAIAIQNKVFEEAGIQTPSSEAMSILMKEMQAKLQKETDQHSEAKRKWENDLRLWQNNEMQRRNELLKATADLEELRSKFKHAEVTHQSEICRFQGKIDTLLQEEADRLKVVDNSFLGRVAKGTVAGSGVGLAGGPSGALVGGAAGGVVGGLSYAWEKIGFW